MVLGPGSYSPTPGHGHNFGARLGPGEWSIDPRRNSWALKSETIKSPMPRPLTAECNHGKTYGISADYLKWLQGDVPGSKASPWGKNARKPPHFHIPFKPYPFIGGEPKGREKGLDEFYEVDKVAATPIGLHATLEVNMKRTNRKYHTVFRSKVPARPRSASTATPDDVGPGKYKTHEPPEGSVQLRHKYNAITLKEPSKPSPAFIPYSGGMYKGVGGVYEHHDLY